jgi:hypothetical protein
MAAGAPASGTAFVAVLRERRRAGGRRSGGSVKMRPLRKLAVAEANGTISEAFAKRLEALNWWRKQLL